jgi:SM-20-related protein
LLASEDVFEAAAMGLLRQGWWVGDQVLEPELLRALLANLLALREEDRLRRAGIGRESDFQVRPDIRGDRIHWLNRSNPVQAGFIAQMEQLRLALNQRLFLGLFEFEAHFAYYPEGAGYARHLDSFRGASSRLVSTVAYLNTDWQPGDGGELVLYTETGDEIVQVIEPKGGRLALFLSEEVPHEVLPARRDRFSIAGWFRINASVQGQIDPSR